MNTFKQRHAATQQGPFDSSAMSEDARLAATAQLRRAEELVDLCAQGLSKVRAIVLLIVHGFNLMRHKVRLSDVSAASTRLVG